MRNIFKRFMPSSGSTHVTTMMGQPSFIAKKHSHHPEFVGNVIVYRCISLIAKSICSIPLLVYENDQETQKHPLAQLLKAPNPRMNYQMFMNALTHHFLLWGNAYVYTHLSEAGNCLALLSPELVQTKFDDNGYPESYQYGQNDKKKTYHIDLEANQESVLHLHSFNPDHPWIGMSPLSSCRSAVQQHNAIGAHNVALLNNGGRPSGALIVDDNLNDTDRQQLRHDIDNLYSSPDNAGRILLLEGMFKWQELGLSPKNMDFLAGKHVAVQEIATAFGISPILVGLTEDASFNNYKEARLQFWEDTVIPLLRFFVDHMNFWFQKIYPTVHIGFDMDAILALSPRRQEIWDQLNHCTFLTDEEKRHALGYGTGYGK